MVYAQIDIESTSGRDCISHNITNTMRSASQFAEDMWLENGARDNLFDVDKWNSENTRVSMPISRPKTSTSRRRLQNKDLERNMLTPTADTMVVPQSRPYRAKTKTGQSLYSVSVGNFESGYHSRPKSSKGRFRNETVISPTSPPLRPKSSKGRGREVIDVPTTSPTLRPKSSKGRARDIPNPSSTSPPLLPKSSKSKLRDVPVNVSPTSPSIRPKSSKGRTRHLSEESDDLLDLRIDTGGLSSDDEIIDTRDPMKRPDSVWGRKGNRPKGAIADDDDDDDDSDFDGEIEVLDLDEIVPDSEAIPNSHSDTYDTRTDTNAWDTSDPLDTPRNYPHHRDLLNIKRDNFRRRVHSDSDRELSFEDKDSFNIDDSQPGPKFLGKKSISTSQVGEKVIDKYRRRAVSDVNNHTRASVAKLKSMKNKDEPLYTVRNDQASNVDKYHPAMPRKLRPLFPRKNSSFDHSGSEPDTDSGNGSARDIDGRDNVFNTNEDTIHNLATSSLTHKRHSLPESRPVRNDIMGIMTSPQIVGRHRGVSSNQVVHGLNNTGTRSQRHRSNRSKYSPTSDFDSPPDTAQCELEDEFRKLEGGYEHDIHTPMRGVHNESVLYETTKPLSHGSLYSKSHADFTYYSKKRHIGKTKSNHL